MIKTKIKTLMQIVSELNAQYPKKAFTLDGRLVGDIGEVIAEDNYMLELYDKVEKKYDAVSLIDNKRIQIKATMKNAVGYPRDYHPERLLAVMVKEDGNFVELYNGETTPLISYMDTRTKNPNYNCVMITIGILEKLNKLVDNNTRIQRRDLS